MSRHRQPHHHRKDSSASRRHVAPPGARREGGPQGEFIMGRNCLEEVMKRSPGRLLEVYIAESRDEGQGRSGQRRSDIVERLDDLSIPVREVSRRELD